MVNGLPVEESYKTENVLLLLIDKSRYGKYLQIDIHLYHNNLKDPILLVCDL